MLLTVCKVSGEWIRPEPHNGEQGADHRPKGTVHKMSVRKLLLLLLGWICSWGSAAGRPTTTTRVATGKALTISSPEKGALELFLSTIRNARHHLAAAAVARSVSIFGMYPVDTIKVRTRQRYHTAVVDVSVVTNFN